MLRKLFAVLCFAPLASFATVTALPGTSPQSAPPDEWFAPLRIAVTDSAGNPVAGAHVRSYFPGVLGGITVDALCYPDLGYTCDSVTDDRGVAILPRAHGSHPGTYTVYVSTTAAGRDESITLQLDVDSFAAPISLQDMWWSGPLENGWGMSVAQHGNAFFAVVYAYDDAGNPRWWVLPAGQWLSTPGYGATFEGQVYSPRSAPFFAYDVTQFQPGSPLGTGTLRFGGPDGGSISGAFSGTAVTKSIRRQDYSGAVPLPVAGVGDMWWGGPGQNGWGVAIMEQPGGLFAVWLTYGDDGKPTWFVMPAGTWQDARTYAGAMYQTLGSPWHNYDAAKLRITDSGSFALHFIDGEHATLDYSIKGHSGTLALQRQSF